MMARFGRSVLLLSVVFFGVVILWSGVAAQMDPVSPDIYGGLHWRNIGPFHGGRISAVSGVIGQAGTFYIGTPQGGIWKTTSAGSTWYPIFDQVTEVDGIGAIQVAPSDPNIIYAGTGDSVGGPDGNGMYKSTDAGKTWKHIGLGGDHEDQQARDRSQGSQHRSCVDDGRCDAQRRRGLSLNRRRSDVAERAEAGGCERDARPGVRV